MIIREIGVLQCDHVYLGEGAAGGITAIKSYPGETVVGGEKGVGAEGGHAVPAVGVALL